MEIILCIPLGECVFHDSYCVGHSVRLNCLFILVYCVFFRHQVDVLCKLARKFIVYTGRT